jgi:hypothetical protein
VALFKINDALNMAIELADKIETQIVEKYYHKRIKCMKTAIRVRDVADKF